MSGIYLVVWDNVEKDRTSVLRTTKGGYPHVTLAHTGKNLSVDSLKQTASQVFQTWGNEQITLEKAQVNSFSDRLGVIRHDVLLSINRQDELEETRRVHLISKFENHGTFHMRPLHVTYGIYEEEHVAARVAKVLNETFLPYKVTITGVCID